jgi:DegV family protein with EDD domain
MVKIVTDTTSCLSPEFSREYNVPIIPQVINFGNDSYLEGVDMDIAMFMQRLRASKELPKTAAPPPELFREVFSTLVPQGEPILCIHPSAEVSGTVRSATVAAQEFPEADIRVIDTRLVSSPLGTMVNLAAQWAANGETADTIEGSILAMIPTCRIYFLVDTLEYLAKGGRIGGAQALVGSILQIKPILSVKDGKVDQFDKVRTHRHALTRLKELVVAEYPNVGNGYLTVMHAGVYEEAVSLAEDLAAALNLPPVPVFNMPPAITTHAGPGVLGVGFFVKPS